MELLEHCQGMFLKYKLWYMPTPSMIRQRLKTGLKYSSAQTTSAQIISAEYM